MAINQLLRAGQIVHTVQSNMPCEIESFIGGGGQGEVYMAKLGTQGSPASSVALKWYYPLSATEAQRKALEDNIRKGSPNNNFLWPMDLVREAGVDGFGYIMRLRHQRYKGMLDWIFRRIKPKFRHLAIAGRDLADGFWQLHAKGLSYRDISFGNVFFDPDTGEVLICDNDNVSVDGEVSGILGTDEFMAPEIVRGEALPSAATDRYSLAVLLFFMFMLNHPLKGKREANIHVFDAIASREIFGNNPLFIYDPQDTSNEPEPGWQDNAIIFWKIYPKFLRDTFTQAFTVGLRDPINGRVGETTWRDTMIRLHDSIFYCSCGAENFYDVAKLQETGGNPGKCWREACGQNLRLPYRIRIGTKTVMLNHDSKLYPYHMSTSSNPNFSAPTAEVTRHPNDPTLWGLKNLTQEQWVATPANGVPGAVPPGRSVSLAVGTKVNFGHVEGQIAY